MQRYEDFLSEMEGLDKDILTNMLYSKEKMLEGALENARIWKHRYDGVRKELHQLRNAGAARARGGSEREKQMAELVSELERLRKEKKDLQDKNREIEEEFENMQGRLRGLEDIESHLTDIALSYHRKADEARGRAKAYRKAFEFVERTKSSLTESLLCQMFRELIPEVTFEECGPCDDESCDEEMELHSAHPGGSRG